jgi:hypothetical protein
MKVTTEIETKGKVHIRLSSSGETISLVCENCLIALLTAKEADQIARTLQQLSCDIEYKAMQLMCPQRPEVELRPCNYPLGFAAQEGINPTATETK